MFSQEFLKFFDDLNLSIHTPSILLLRFPFYRTAKIQIFFISATLF